MTFQKFSKKQMRVFNWWTLDDGNYAIIADGAIRSGKTLSMSISFVLWSNHTFNGQTFAICGKTIESLRRNVIIPLITALKGLFIVKESRSQNYIEITGNGKTNRYYLFGGRDESSYALVQGITLAGIMFDEVALMPRSFVEQSMARCSVSGSRFWFNCNPENPEHWFYKEWILDPEGRKNRIYLHFTMEDNLSLDEAIKKRYENQYSGVFYDRYIRGKWVLAEGLIYKLFDKNTHVTDKIPNWGEYYISIDYGTVNPFSAGLWCVSQGVATRISEYYFDSRTAGRQMTDEEYYAEVEKLAGDFNIQCIVVDPSAASFIQCIVRHGKYVVRQAKNDVLDGIRVTSSLLNAKKLKIHESCGDCIREFGLYRWDEKGTSDAVLKENDHAMDDVRYFCYTVLRRDFWWDKWE